MERLAGNDDIATVVAPKMGYSLDNQVACEDEEDPALRAAGSGREACIWSCTRTAVDLRRLERGAQPRVLSSDGHGVVPAGGAAHVQGQTR